MDIHDLTAAYALDALDADETREYEAHLAQCVRCRADLSTLSESATALAWAVDAPAPPQRPARADPLRGGGRARERHPASCPQSLDPAHDGGDRRGRSLHRGRPRDLGDLALALREPGAVCARAPMQAPSRSSPIRPRAACRSTAATASSRSIGTGKGVLVVDRLASAPSGKTYEAWVIPRGEPQRPPGSLAAAATRRSSGSSIRSRAAR